MTKKLSECHNAKTEIRYDSLNGTGDVCTYCGLPCTIASKHDASPDLLTNAEVYDIHMNSFWAVTLDICRAQAEKDRAEILSLKADRKRLMLELHEQDAKLKKYLTDENGNDVTDVCKICESNAEKRGARAENKRIVDKLEDYFGKRGMGKPHGRATLARTKAKELLLELLFEEYTEQAKLKELEER